MSGAPKDRSAVQQSPPKRKPNRGKKGGTVDRHMISFRLSAAQFEAVKERAVARSLTRSSYAREKLVADIEGPAPVSRLPVDRALLVKTLAHLGHIGGNLNQLAYRANTGDMPTAREIEAALDALRSRMNDIRAALGRQVLP
jgi:hypothetical protein